MLTYALMVILIIFLSGCSLYGLKIDRTKSSFMSVNDSSFLRGFWCFVVVLVHVPAAYQNRIQDMIGSFAYIGVTFFFMTSAYGLKYSIKYKQGYMSCFWLKRLPALLVPALIANALRVIAEKYGGSEMHAHAFLNINAWVKVLLLMYVGFWIIYGLMPKICEEGRWQDIAMVLFVITCSILQRFTNTNITLGWIVEPLGFAYGIIAARFAERICEWFDSKWIIKTLGLMVLSCILGIAYLVYKPVPVWGDYFLKILLGISCLAFMFSAIAKLRVGNGIIHFLGDISYEIYLLHGSVFTLIMASNKQVMNSGCFIWVSLLVTLVLAILLKRLSTYF